MTEIQVPKLNANDDMYALLSWLVKDGEPITAGDAVAEVETSKAIEELAAADGGFLFHTAVAGAPIAPGEVIGVIAAAPERPIAVTAVASTAPAQIITAPARARMAALGITEDQVKNLPIAVVRAADIDSMAAPDDSAQASGSTRLSKAQRAVGRAVTRSHATIPAAYAVVKFDVGPALARAAALVRQVRRPVGLAELFVEAVAALHNDFPLFFASLSDDGESIRPSGAPHVGVTLDLGAGLFVPVVHDAAAATIAVIARQLTDFRLAAAEGTFRAAQLDGANIAVTLHTDGDVMLAIPFVFPGQVCALAVTTPQVEVVLSADGQVGTRMVAHIGLAYDHRVVNGRDAGRFLDTLKEKLR